MSFTLDLIVSRISDNDTVAWAEINNLREAYYDDKSKVDEKLLKLHDILIEKYPCLCSYDDDDSEMENCPWADGPMLNNFASKMGMLAIVYSRVEEVFPFILEAALALDIIVADAQDEKIYRPGDEIELKADSKPWWKFW